MENPVEHVLIQDPLCFAVNFTCILMVFNPLIRNLFQLVKLTEGLKNGLIYMCADKIRLRKVFDLWSLWNLFWQRWTLLRLWKFTLVNWLQQLARRIQLCANFDVRVLIFTKYYLRAICCDCWLKDVLLFVDLRLVSTINRLRLQLKDLNLLFLFYFRIQLS